MSRSVAITLVSALAGCVGAWLLWQFIYSIGDRVITDDLHYSMEGSIYRCGLVAGLGYGQIGFGSIRSSWRSLWLSHMVALVLGCVGSTFGWMHGIWIYFLSLQMLSALGRLLIRSDAPQLSVPESTK